MGKRYTDEEKADLLRRIALKLAAGRTLPLACQECGVSFNTVRQWKYQEEDVALQLDQARAECVGSAIDNVRSSPDWRASAYLAGVLHPDYREKKQIDITADLDAKLATKLTELRTLISDSAWKELVAAMKIMAAQDLEDSEGR